MLKMPLTPSEQIQFEKLVVDVREKMKRDQANGKTLPKRVKVTIEFTVVPSIPTFVEDMCNRWRYESEIYPLERWFNNLAKIIEKPSRLVIDEMTRGCVGLIKRDEVITMSIEDIPVEPDADK